MFDGYVSENDFSFFFKKKNHNHKNYLNIKYILTLTPRINYNFAYKKANHSCEDITSGLLHFFF